MKTKSEFVYIEPKDSESRLIFEVDFKGLHSCKVIKKEDERILVKSIAGEYYFWISKCEDSYWNIIK